MADSKGRSWILKVAGLVIVVLVLRANLPPDNVAESLDMGSLESKSGVGGALGRFAVGIITNEMIADWEYTDLGIFKIAHSERLDRTAIGLPFCKWKIQAADD